jgi:hypothetical protein
MISGPAAAGHVSLYKLQYWHVTINFKSIIAHEIKSIQV